MFEQTFKRLDDVLWKEAGCTTELDYTEQSSWLLFLKYLDDLEHARATEAELRGQTYTPIIDAAHRWTRWAAPKDADGKLDHNRALTGPDLINYVNRELFPYLEGFSIELYQLPPLKLQTSEGSTQAILYGPRSFAEMSRTERVQACYQHSVLKWLHGEKMRNVTLCERFGIDKRNAAQVSQVLNAALKEKLIKVADIEHPKSGYWPWWG